MSVPDLGPSDIWEVPEVPEAPKVAQIGVQRLPRPKVRTCATCGSVVQVHPSIWCPVHGPIAPKNVLSIRKD